MWAYVAYVGIILVCILIGFVLGHDVAANRRETVNVAKLKNDACERCIYLNRCLDIYKDDMQMMAAHLESNYCKKCSLRDF